MLIEVRPNVIAESRGQYFKEIADRNHVDNASRRCIARLIQRNSPNGKIQRPLLTYDLYGQNLQNPAEEKPRKQLETTVASIIRERTLGLSFAEKQYVGMILPELVSALALDERYISKIYQRDLTAPIEIALYWFLHPEDIDQTVFRVGFGGETAVNSRAPSYIVPALQTIERVKNVFAIYSNWALYHELHERKGEKNEEINSYTAQKIAEAINRTNGHNQNPSSQIDYLEEIQLAKKLSPEHTRMILQDAWLTFVGERPDLEELGKKYHFTNKLPKLVVFNAANAAIEIDGMNRDDVITARDQTQKLLKAYVDTFHPDLSNCLIFQNDKEWSEHDPYTRLLPLFLREFIDRHDGKIGTIDETLYQFGQHHQRTKDKTIMGIPAPKLYAILHREFFEDPLLVGDWTEKLPRSKIMEDIGFIPKHIIFHQGEPEIEFGAYRKLISEKVSLSELLRWLEQRKSLVSLGYKTVAEEVSGVANRLYEQSSSKKEYRSCLGGALSKVCKGKPSLKAYFTSLLGSPVFQEAQDQKVAWEQYIERLKKEVVIATPEDIQTVIDQLTIHRASVQIFYDEVDTSLIYNKPKLSSLAEKPEAAFVINPQRRFEMTLTIGRIPVYYPLRGADGILWPNRELASLGNYRDRLVQAETRKRRLEGTIAFTASKLIPLSLASENTGWSLLANGIEEFAKQAIKPDVQKAWQGADTRTLRGLYDEADTMEINGSPPDEIIGRLKSGIVRLVENRIQEVMSVTGLGYEQAHLFVSQIMKSSSLVTEANQKTRQDAEVEMVKAMNVLWDYNLLLADIDSDPTEAERRYNKLIAITLVT